MGLGAGMFPGTLCTSLSPLSTPTLVPTTHANHPVSRGAMSSGSRGHPGGFTLPAGVLWPTWSSSISGAVDAGGYMYREYREGIPRLLPAAGSVQPANRFAIHFPTIQGGGLFSPLLFDVFEAKALDAFSPRRSSRGRAGAWASSGIQPGWERARGIPTLHPPR